MEEKSKKFGVKDQLCYFFGDVGGSFVNIYVDTYFLIFCTYCLGIKAAFMGTLFLVARIWDAINDPLIGSIPDRHLLGKSGDRFKPYIRLMMLPLALSGLMCFADVSSFASVWKHVWISVAYILYGMCYTGTSMPYGSMATVITNDSIENTKLSRARSFGGATVTLVMAIVPMIIYDDDHNPIKSMFFILAIVFGICSLLCYCILLKGSTERHHYEVKKDEYNYGEVVKNCIRNRPLIGAMIAAVGFLFYGTGFAQVSQYLFKEYYHNPELATFATLIQGPVMILLFPFIPKLVRTFGKAKAVLYPAVFSAIVSTLLFVVPIKNPYIFLLLNVFAVIGPMAYTLNCWAIVSDCIEYHEWKFGQKANGSIFSIYTFARKIGSALASAFASYALAAIGFISGINNQTEEVAARIRYLVTAVPMIASILIVIGLGVVYNISKKQMEEIHEEIINKKNV